MHFRYRCRLRFGRRRFRRRRCNDGGCWLFDRRYSGTLQNGCFWWSGCFNRGFRSNDLRRNDCRGLARLRNNNTRRLRFFLRRRRGRRRNRNRYRLARRHSNGLSALRRNSSHGGRSGSFRWRCGRRLCRLGGVSLLEDCFHHVSRLGDVGKIYLCLDFVGTRVTGLCRLVRA